MPGNYYNTQASFVETIFHFIKKIEDLFQIGQYRPSSRFSIWSFQRLDVHINFISLNCKLKPILTQNGKLLVRTPWNSDIDGLPWFNFRFKTKTARKQRPPQEF